MSKAMTRATAGHNLRVTMAIVALAAVLLALTLVAVLQTASTTSDSAATSANPAMSAESKGGPTSVGYDPTIDRGEVNPAMSAEGTGGSSITQDPSIERHAEVVQRLGNGSLR